MKLKDSITIRTGSLTMAGYTGVSALLDRDLVFQTDLHLAAVSLIVQDDLIKKPQIIFIFLSEKYTQNDLHSKLYN